MADKYLARIEGQTTQVEATVQSAGVDSAGDIPALDGTGRLDSTVMPSGIGAEQVTVTASGNLAQWDLVNVYLDGEVLKARKANAGTNQYVAHAFCPNAILDTEQGIIQSNGIITGVGLTPGAKYFLSDTPGTYSATPAAGTGKIDQMIGYALSTTVLVFEPEEEIVLA